jgi:hypothetical protein
VRDLALRYSVPKSDNSLFIRGDATLVKKCSIQQTSCILADLLPEFRLYAQTYPQKLWVAACLLYTPIVRCDTLAKLILFESLSPFWRHFPRSHFRENFAA